MKKILFILILIIILLTGASTLTADEGKRPEREYVEKTYFLKNVEAEFALRSLRVYIENHSSRGQVLSVTIQKDKVKKFEELLKRIDAPRKRITFRIFTIISSHEGQSEKIKNKDLKKVLEELSEILSISGFRQDGVGAITVKEGSHQTMLSLTSRSGLDLKLLLQNISISRAASGEKSVNFKFHLLEFIHSETSIRENGYLVAGVSKLGKNGDSLILVINADIE